MRSLIAFSLIFVVSATSIQADDFNVRENSVIPTAWLEDDCAPESDACVLDNGECGDANWLEKIFNTDFKSDRAFSGFIEPLTNPVYFEDPRSRTRLRLLFVNQMIPEDTPILEGGDFQAYGAQVTVAINERFAIIAEKDGYIELQADGLPNEEGWADIATGFKYVFVRDVENQFLLTGGMMYEWSNGSRNVFQGNGDGTYNFFLSTAKEFGDCGEWHLMGTAGWHLPGHGGEESESIFYNLHIDRRLTDKLYVLAEMTGTHYTESGRRLPVSFEGGDLINLGATDVAGNHIVSMAFGGAYKFNQHMEFAAAYEVPVTEREDIMDNRVTAYLALVY